MITLTSVCKAVISSSSSSSSSLFRIGRSKRLFPIIQMAAAAGTSFNCIVVYVTVPTKESGKKLAESIVQLNLAACVNRVPGIQSVYKWQGTIHTDNEELLIIKTRESLLDALTQHVRANHQYDVPEVIALPIVGGSIPYLEWIQNNTRDSTEES